MAEVIWPTRLSASAGQFEPAKWLPAHKRPRDPPIDIQITDAKFPPGAVNIRGAAREYSAR